ncbi:MAG: hypothetical protein ACI8RZ_002237 [Myxococcota bacterium]|jgi:hypothetical protein
MILLLSLACKTTPPPPTGVAPDAPSTTTPALPVEEDEVTRETITLDPDEITYDEPAGTAVFSPGSRVRSSSYTHYILELGSVESVLGGRPTEPVSVVVEITGIEDSTYSPDEPEAAQPDGGFQIINKTGRIVSRAP